MTKLIKIEGDYLIASFLSEKITLDKINNFLPKFVSLLRKHKLKLVGVYKNNEKLNSGVDRLTYKNLFMQNSDVFRIYLSGNIGNTKTLCGLYFYDCEDYVELEFVAPHFEIIESLNPETYEINMLEFLKIAKDIYFFTKPLYGLIGQEEFAPCLENILNKKSKLPNFWGFYSKKVVKAIGFRTLWNTLKGCYILEKLSDGGVFFAISNWESGKVLNKDIMQRKDALIKLNSKFIQYFKPPNPNNNH